MRRSAAIILFLGLIFPAVGQSDRLGRQDSGAFAPRGQSSTTRSARRFGSPPAGSYQPPGYQPGGNRPRPANAGSGGRGYSQGYPPQGRPTQASPAQGSPAGGVSPTGLPGQVPAKGFLLDARNARAEEGRVPNGFGQLGLSDDQRARIYGIQALYDHHIERLEALIERLESEEDLQYQYVLTPAQRRMYQRYKASKE